MDADRREDLRLAVYESFRRTGAAPSPEQLAATTGLTADAVTTGLAQLHDNRDLVLRDGQIVMAHPFASVPLGFSVMGSDTLWWGGCAWDSFALPHLIPEQPAVLVATTCPGCGTALAWVVDRDTPPAGDQLAHFLTSADHIWDDVVHSCAHQRLFCSEDCIQTWLTDHDARRGYVMDLATLWRLARGWYAGRLDRGYRRKEPAQAADYFRSVGLHGPFWGLPD